MKFDEKTPSQGEFFNFCIRNPYLTKIENPQQICSENFLIYI